MTELRHAITCTSAECDRPRTVERVVGRGRTTRIETVRLPGCPVRAATIASVDEDEALEILCSPAGKSWARALLRRFTDGLDSALDDAAAPSIRASAEAVFAMEDGRTSDNTDYPSGGAR